MRDNKKRKKQSRVLKIVGISLTSVVLGFFVLFITAYFITGTVFFNFALDATFASVANAPKDLVTKLPTPRLSEEWFGEVEREEKQVESDDGYKLHAYFVPAEEESNVFVISIHGYRGKSLEMTFYAQKFHDAGYNVLLPDLKGHGESEGKYIGMGYLDRFDVLKWIDLITQMNPEAIIVLHGVSMGGAAVMSATGEELPPNVVCAIEDCGFSNVYFQFNFVVKNVMRLPFAPIIMSSAALTARAKLKISLKEMDIISQLKKSKTPTMFIHGSEDNFVPLYMLDEVYKANNQIEKEKLVVEGASHAYSATKDPDTYFSSVLGFITKYI